MLVHIDGRVTVTCDRCHVRFRVRFRPEDAPETMSDEELALERGWQRSLDGFRQARAVDKDTGRAMIQVAQPGHLCPAHAIPVTRTNVERVTRSPAVLVTPEEDEAFEAMDAEVIDAYAPGRKVDEVPPAEKAKGVWSYSGYEDDGDD